jgi:hypothetical protein
MALRDKLAQRAAPYLEPGEQVRYVFQAQQGPSPWLLGALFQKFRIVCVTDRAIVVLSIPKMKAKPDGVIARLPRATEIGRMKGVFGKTYITGKKMYVHRRFHKDVAAADAELAPAVAR